MQTFSKTQINVVKPSIRSSLIPNNESATCQTLEDRIVENLTDTPSSDQTQTSLSVLSSVPLISTSRLTPSHTPAPCPHPPFVPMPLAGNVARESRHLRADPHLPKPSNTGRFYMWLGLDNSLYLQGGRLSSLGLYLIPLHQLSTMKYCVLIVWIIICIINGLMGIQLHDMWRCCLCDYSHKINKKPAAAL